MRPPLGAEEARRRARRALLRLGAWAVPAVLGTFAVTRSAEAQTCNPSVCKPLKCNPFCKPNCAP